MNLHKFYIDFTSEGYNFYTAVKRTEARERLPRGRRENLIEENIKIEFEVEENGKNHSEGRHEK